MNNYPKISILVPVYKVEKLIARCAISLFEQTYENIEYIFVDDCTPDRSIEILSNIMQRYPKRATCTHIITHDHNRGQATARNTLIEAATGDFVAYVDSDDYIDKRMIEKGVKKLLKNNADIVKFDIKVIRKCFTQSFHALPTSDPRKLFLALAAGKCNPFLFASLYRRDLFVKHNIRCIDGVNMGEDWLMGLQLAYNAQKVDYLNEVMYYYDCTNENQTTAKFNEENIAMLYKEYEIVGEFLKDKGKDVWEAFMCKKAELTVRMLKTYALAPGNHTVQYKKTLSECRTFESKYFSTTRLRHKVLKYIKSYKLAQIYMCFVTWCGERLRKNSL